MQIKKIFYTFWNLPKSTKVKYAVIVIISGVIIAKKLLSQQKQKRQPQPANQLSPNESDAIIVQEICYPNIVSKVDSQNHLSQFALPRSMELINQLLDNSSRKRNVDENLKYYLIETLEERDLQNYYSIKKLSIKKQLQQYCTKMIHVRGDGNCFYTSFGYQFMKIVIYQYSDEEFDQFLQENFTIPFKIQLNDISFGNEEQQRELLNQFRDRIKYLRNLEKYYKQHEHYSNQLVRQFRAHEMQDDLDGYFQPLTTLFLRNLSMHIVEQSEDGQNVVDKETLLKWEEECNSNEQVIAMLAKHLRLHIQLIFFAGEEFQVLEYSKEYENKNRSIILLIKPGHYNIGIKN
ncbi:unnamed protein product [Paramecium pentaurelia]|uniref:OTU domain-containing protein n=1 Tax=Paramecium pentaurelia TaxID=43138 RepID=A0A8S1V4Z2_9CILI|nr:unnamed protein product [Paramecium pentaurelia]